MYLVVLLMNASIETQQTAQGVREKANISAQGAADKANIQEQQREQAKREIGNIQAQGEADKAELNSCGPQGRVRGGGLRSRVHYPKTVPRDTTKQSLLDGRRTIAPRLPPHEP